MGATFRKYGQWYGDPARTVAGCNGDIAIVALPSGKIVAVAFAQMGKPDETLANARLIAAAPEMYEALKWAFMVIGDALDREIQLNYLTKELYEEVRYILAKAKE